MSIRASVPRRRGTLDTSAPGADGPQAPAPGRKQAWLLTVCCVAQFMVILDLSIVNVALPSIQASLGFTAIGLQWVVDAYSIIFAGFLMLGGRVADTFGQRRSLAAALLLFALASLAGGMATDQAMLITARAVQGLSAALMAAASLATITSSFPPGPSRHRAIGLWGAMNGAGGAAGGLFGGIITQELGWRWVLLINPPIGVAAALVTWYVVTDRPTKDRSGFDLAGAVTLTAGLMVTAYGFVNASSYGWTTAVALVPILAGFAITGLFPVIEARVSDPLVPLRAVTGQLRSANLIVLLFSAALFPMWYVSSLYLQQVLGLTPLQAGLAFFPMALVIMLTAQRAGRLVGRFGVRTVLASGLVLLASGMLLLARIGDSGSAIGFVVLPGLLVAVGIGLSIVPSTIAATQAAGHQQAGLASGLVNTSRQVGGALGIALLISLATGYTSHLIGTGTQVSEALTQGFRVAYLIAAGLALLAAVAAATLLRTQPVPGRRLAVRLTMPAVVVVVLAVFATVDFTAAGAPGAPIGTYTTRNAYSFVSAPGLHPPKITASTPTDSSQLEPGYILLANFFNVTTPPIQGQSGPLILSNSLQPVWFQPVPAKDVASNLEEQTYQGQPVLSWWEGTVTATGATETGRYVVVNQHYQPVATLHGTDGWVLTLHSMVISGDDAWVTANKNLPMNISRYGGSADGAIVDSAVQEYNLKTGALVRSWDALDHIPVSDSYAIPQTNGFPWDAYHVNSISLAPHGDLLVSMRNTWAAYLINPVTGKIIWTLGGKQSSFAMAADARFEWQHDVTIQGTKVTLFDDNCCQISGAGTYLAPNGPSRAMTLSISPAARTATLQTQYTHDGESAAYMGSTELLPDGNVFVGFGELPYFSEYSSSGQRLLDGVFPGPDMSYRAIQVQHWTGLPLTRPSAVARRAGGTTKVYVSWNGATQVRSWRVLAGPSAGALHPVATAGKGGFQTAIAVPSGARVFQVQALSAQGKVIGTSTAVTAS
jgi:EmrB/QacA subfamily drug resistance transporter